VTPIASARDGLVKFVGVIGGESLERSLYGDALVAVREVHHYTVEGRGPTAVRVLARVERSRGIFWIDDDSGRITLDPSNTRIDFESDGADGDANAEELRLRAGERVAIIGRVRREEGLASHPLRRAAVQGTGGLRFESPPVVTWRTEPEVYPRLRPPASAAALSASSVALAVLGTVLQV
jgi:hypothetical protein